MGSSIGHGFWLIIARRAQRRGLATTEEDGERAHLSHLFKVGAYVLHRVGHVCDEDDAAGSRGRKTEERTRFRFQFLPLEQFSEEQSGEEGFTRTRPRRERTAREMRGFARVMETGLVFMVLR